MEWYDDTDRFANSAKLLQSVLLPCLTPWPLFQDSTHKKQLCGLMLKYSYKMILVVKFSKLTSRHHLNTKSDWVPQWYINPFSVKSSTEMSIETAKYRAMSFHSTKITNSDKLCNITILEDSTLLPLSLWTEFTRIDFTCYDYAEEIYWVVVTENEIFKSVCMHLSLTWRQTHTYYTMLAMALILISLKAVHSMILRNISFFYISVNHFLFFFCRR